MKFVCSFSWLMFAVVLSVKFVSADSQVYESTAFKETIYGDWPFKTFSTMVRNGIRNSNDIKFPWGFLMATTKDDINIVELAQSAFSAQYPLLVPAVVGLLAAVLVPCITLLFCCCRCWCGYCGGKLTQSDIDKQSAAGMIGNGFTILIASGIVIAMGLCLPISGERVRASPSTFVDSLEHSAHDFPIFVATFVQEAKDVVASHLNDSIVETKDILTDLPHVLSEPLTESTGAFFTTIESDVKSIQHAMESLAEVEVETNTTVLTVITHLESLEKALNDLSTNLTTIKTKCETDGKLFCDELPKGADEPVDFDTQALSDLTSLITDLVGQTEAVNLTGYLAMGNRTFASIPEIIHNSSDTTVQSLLEILDEVPDMVLPAVNSALDTLNEMTEKVGLDEKVESLDNTVDSIDAMVKPIFDAAMKALGTYVALIGGTASVGLVLGCLCRGKSYDSTQGRNKATGCGAVCLMISVAQAAVIILFVLLLGSAFLLIGGNLTLVCNTVQEMTIEDQLYENGVLSEKDTLSYLFFGHNNVNISVQRFLSNCRDDGTLLSSFNISSMINFTDVFNVTEFVPNLDQGIYDSINSTMRDIDMFDVAFLNNIADKLSFSSNDSEDGMQSMREAVNEIDLMKLASNMTRVANDIPDEWYSSAYKSIAAALENVHNVTKVPLMQGIDDLESRLDELKGAGHEIKDAISELNTTLNTVQAFIHNDAAGIMFESIEDFVNKMQEVPNSLIDNILHTLASDVGQCKIIGDMYDSVTGSICIFFLDGFNSLWAGLYVAGLTFIFLMVANCQLGQYFRKANARQPPAANRNFNADGNHDIAIPMDSFTHLLAGDNANNNSLLFAPHSRIERLKNYLSGSRIRYSTGSQSPELLRITQLSQSLSNAREKRQLANGYGEQMKFYHSIQTSTGPVLNSPQPEIIESLTMSNEDDSLHGTSALSGKDYEEKLSDKSESGSVTISEEQSLGFSTFKMNNEYELDMAPLPNFNENYPLLSEMKRVKKTSSQTQKHDRSDTGVAGIKRMKPEMRCVRNVSDSVSGVPKEDAGLLQKCEMEEAVPAENLSILEAESGKAQKPEAIVVDESTNHCKDMYKDHPMREIAEKVLDELVISSVQHVKENDQKLGNRQKKTAMHEMIEPSLKITCVLCRKAGTHTTSQSFEHLDKVPVVEQDTQATFGTADSFEAHLNDFETAYMDLSNSFQRENIKEKTENINETELCKRHREESFKRKTGKALNIKVRPYAQKAEMEAKYGKWWSEESISQDAEELSKPKVKTQDLGNNRSDADLQNGTTIHSHQLRPACLQNLAVHAFFQSAKTNQSNTEQGTAFESSGDQDKDLQEAKDLCRQSLSELATEIMQCVVLADSVDQDLAKQPQSLVVLSSKAIVEEALSRVLPTEPVKAYSSATTERNSDKLTYM